MVPPTIMAQSGCNNPEQLCGDQFPAQEALTTPDPVLFDCLDAEYVNYYYFTTNNNAVPGTAFIELININCGPTDNDSISAVVVSYDNNDPCNPASYSAVSLCDEDTLTIAMQTISLQTSTSYMVIVGTNNDPVLAGCGFEISVSGNAVDIDACCDQALSLGQSVSFGVVGGDAVPGYVWQPSTYLDDQYSDDPTAFPEETMSYIVTGYIDGCEVVDVVTLIVGPPLTVPNTFTPNGDGINDFWRIGRIGNFPEAQITVFDRWGQVVFKGFGDAGMWDGTNKGKFLPTATYFYIIELNSMEIKSDPITGSISIVH
jgi:gliding motility-associated-like protein